MNRQYVNYSCLEFFFVHSSCWMLTLGTEKLKISYCMIKILILGRRNYCIWKLYRIRWFLYGFLACRHQRGRCFQIRFKQVQLTQFWPGNGKTSLIVETAFQSSKFDLLNSDKNFPKNCRTRFWRVSIKQVRLTQFWRILGDDTMKSWATFQSSKFDLLNSDVS